LIYTVKIYEHTSSIIIITIVKRTIKLNMICRLLWNLYPSHIHWNSFRLYL